MASVPAMSDDAKKTEQPDKNDRKPYHEPPSGAETTGTWGGGATRISRV